MSTGDDRPVPMRQGQQHGSTGMVKAYEATIRIRLRPEVIGPDAGQSPGAPEGHRWTDKADAADYLSSVLSSDQWETILDWGYVASIGAGDPDLDLALERAWATVETRPSDEYEEGEMFAEDRDV